MFRVPRDDAKDYLMRQHRAVQERVARCVAARPRGVRRPDRAVYDAAEGSRKPLGPAFRQIEGLAKLRAHALPEMLPLYDDAMRGIAMVLWDYVDDAIDYSDAVRAAAAAKLDAEGGAA
ncbi:MAG: hypothetical protein ACYC3F_17040 [Gemmatimonadaceae bacterium]